MYLRRDWDLRKKGGDLEEESELIFAFCNFILGGCKK